MGVLAYRDVTCLCIQGEEGLGESMSRRDAAFTGLASSPLRICRVELTKWREGTEEGH